MLQRLPSPSPVESEFPPTPNEERHDGIAHLRHSASTTSFEYPLSASKGLIEVIHDGKIDVEEEERFYRQFDLDNRDDVLLLRPNRHSFIRPEPPQRPSSIFSNDIWLGDNSGESSNFARGVSITGWTNVGDKRGGAYIVFDCAIRTCQDTVIHVHKRFSSFVELRRRLQNFLPDSLQTQLPKLPPKHPLAKYRPSFLDKRRRMLQHWLSAVLLHPELGDSAPVKEWICS